MSLKQKIYFCFEDIRTSWGLGTDLFIIFLVLLTSAVFVIETFDISESARHILDIIDFIIVSIFIVEYLLRFWVADKKIKHLFNIYSIVDLIAILPFFFAFTRLGFIRVFRIFRILRLIRFMESKYYFAKITRDDIFVLARILFTLFTIMFVSSGLIYYSESVMQPDRFNNFFDAFYFSIVTLTTVGFGDLVPVSELGKIFTVLMIVSGILFIPWQVGDFIRTIVRTTRKREITCTNCGLYMHDRDARYCRGCGKKIK